MLFRLLEGRMAAAPRPANYAQLANSCQRLRASTSADRAAAMFIPAAREFALPPPLPGSPFSPANLPINGATSYAGQEEFIRAQCRLLRADTFEATARLLPAVCADLPGYHPSDETKSDVAHARLFGQVRFLARVVAEDRDFAHPDGYILEVQPIGGGAGDFSAHLHPGATVCITTGLHPERLEEGEMFWGVVSSGNAKLRELGAIVVAPCEFGASFAGLQANLRRNEHAGRADRSLLLETPIFMSGYLSIMKALRAFLGPLAIPLPMGGLIIPRPAPAAAVGSARAGGLLPHIPLHCGYAFEEIVGDIRGRAVLDAGQDALMRELPYAEVLLVQGPPGTGKSFIGCRVVEAYVRYKQLLASGDILQRVDADLLSSTRLDALLPVMGPIVVITYKNHALDEFLVDLLNIGLWDEGRPQVGQQLAAAAARAGPRGAFARASLIGSPDVFPGGRRLVRIGGRSKEPRLDPHNFGALLHSMTDKYLIKNLRERIAVLQQRIERLTKEIHYLEKGKVPKTYFLRSLTAEQQQHITFEEREEWLRGERYVGEPLHRPPKVDPRAYLERLRTDLGAALESAGEPKNTPRPGAAARSRPPLRPRGGTAEARRRGGRGRLAQRLPGDEARGREPQPQPGPGQHLPLPRGDPPGAEPPGLPGGSPGGLRVPLEFSPGGAAFLLRLPHPAHDRGEGENVFGPHADALSRGADPQSRDRRGQAEPAARGGCGGGHHHGLRDEPKPPSLASPEHFGRGGGRGGAGDAAPGLHDGFPQADRADRRPLPAPAKSGDLRVREGQPAEPVVV
ncbi:unnamed protein product [Phytomonas sp. Hart1]|nr:unnamed protein product [Phytomonas sp. Hart1]|eukprot:CCW67310.1 unnamed protein product [Phytomonas sp. isolate Hart1]